MVSNKPEPSLPTSSGAGSQTKDNIQLFARKLRELRIRVGLTQEQFAEAAFCSSDHVNKMERGLRLPSSQLLQTMTAAFQKGGLDQALLDELETLLFACRFGEPVATAPAPASRALAFYTVDARPSIDDVYEQVRQRFVHFLQRH